MLSLSALSDVIAAQRKRIAIEATYPRRLLQDIEILRDFAVVVSGIRRCGKSTLLAQLIPQQYSGYVFINFDSPKLFQFTFDDFSLLDELLKTEESTEYLFFDEIQNIPAWEVYVRGKLDEGYKVIISGSNASMLSRELGTKLTGRHISQELFPFSYSEFCGYRSVATDKTSVTAYLQEGGFPQYLATGKQEILHTLIYDILYRDIAVRFNIRDDKSLKNLLMYAVANVSNLISANKLKQIIGVRSTATVQEYLSFLEDAYLIHLVSKFSWSYKKRLVHPRKIYFIDNGLQAAITPSATEDWGRRLENMVFWELRRFTKEIYYFNENTGECDFVICRQNKPFLLIQVCIALHPDNREREQKGLIAAMQYFDRKEAYIITLDQTDKIMFEGKTIHVIPVHQVPFADLIKKT